MELTCKTLDQLDCAHKRVLVRVDFNVPIVDGNVGDDTRMCAALPTLTRLLDAGARLIVMSHLGRPKGTGFEAAYSMRPVATHLQELLADVRVHYVDEVVGPKVKSAAEALNDGEILVIENLRFDPREKAGDEGFARELASLADLYVGDAFGASHRDHASVSGVPRILDGYAGLLMEREVSTLSALTTSPEHPFVAVLGGAKVSDKIGVIKSLLKLCDTIIIGGGMCFTLLKAQGYEVGASLLEEEWVEPCKALLADADKRGVVIALPRDVVVASEFSASSARVTTVPIDQIPQDMMGLDIGPQSVDYFASLIKPARTLFWNGPMGVFEMEAFASGTRAIAQAIASCEGTTIVGGGDSVAAAHTFGVTDQMSYISTGGGASMKLIEGKTLYGVEALSN